MIRTIACIGVGRMGGGIARNLARSHRFEVRVVGRSKAPVEACAAAGAIAAAGMREALDGADLVITCLPMPETVLEVHEANREYSPAGAIWMDASTVDPATARALADGARAAGRRFVACPLGKGPAQAEAGELPLFVGGDEGALEELAEVFGIIGAVVHRMGSVESAAAFKLVSNLIGMTTVALVAEGYELCRAAGVEPAAFLEALKDTGGWSYQADLRLPWMIDGDLANRFGVDLALKDLRLAVEAAACLGVPTPVGAAGLMQLAAAHAQGYGGLDVAAIDRVVAPRRQPRTQEDPGGPGKTREDSEMP